LASLPWATSHRYQAHWARGRAPWSVLYYFVVCCSSPQTTDHTLIFNWGIFKRPPGPTKLRGHIFKLPPLHCPQDLSADGGTRSPLVEKVAQPTNVNKCRLCRLPNFFYQRASRAPISWEVLRERLWWRLCSAPKAHTCATLSYSFRWPRATA
jgi:hypothetical protein